MATISTEIIAKEEIISPKLSEKEIFLEEEDLREKVVVPFRFKEYLKAFEREKGNFEKMKEKLLKNYAGKYVALFEGRVIDSDVDVRRLTGRIQTCFEEKPIYIGPVGDVKTFKIPSPRLKRW